MATKGSSGSRRWIQHRPSDTRPILPMDGSAARGRLERFATIGCLTGAGLIALATIAIYADDFLAGHWHP